MKLIIFALISVSSAFALDYGYLKPTDQQYYKNDIMEGNNSRERTDSLVKEVNKIYGEIANFKTEIANLKEEIELLKKKK